MQGSIRSRGKNTWQIRWEAPRGGDGSRRYRAETVRGTKKEAEAVLRERLRTVERGVYIEPTRETLYGYLTRWLETYAETNCTPRTVYGYRGALRRYVRDSIGGVRLQALQPAHVQGLYAELLERGLSRRTVQHLHRTLREALKHAVQWQLVDRNVCDAVQSPTPERHEVAVWEPDVIQQFIEAAEGNPYRDFFLVALYTGMRRSEVAGLRWPNVDLKNGRIAVVETLQRFTGKGLVAGQPKTARSRRSIVLDPPGLRLMLDIRKRQRERALAAGRPWNESGHVLTLASGRPAYPDEASHEFRKVVLAAGLPPLTLHGLRHLHATTLLQRGVHAKIVSERLGHSTISITLDTYSHVLPGLQESAIRDLGQIFDVAG